MVYREDDSTTSETIINCVLFSEQWDNKQYDDISSK